MYTDYNNFTIFFFTRRHQLYTIPQEINYYSFQKTIARPTWQLQHGLENVEIWRVNLLTSQEPPHCGWPTISILHDAIIEMNCCWEINKLLANFKFQIVIDAIDWLTACETDKNRCEMNDCVLMNKWITILSLNS